MKKVKIPRVITANHTSDYILLQFDLDFCLTFRAKTDGMVS